MMILQAHLTHLGNAQNLTQIAMLHLLSVHRKKVRSIMISQDKKMGQTRLSV